MSNFDSVKKFMLTFGQDVKDKASFPEEKIQNLRVSLIDEELKELKQAIKDSAKAKLIAGEALTQEEADTIVL